MKKLKKQNVFFMGKKMCEIYPYASKWQVLKFKVRKFFRKVIIASFCIGVVYGAFKIGSVVSADTVTYATQEVVKSDNSLKAKIETLKWQIIDTLQSCESGELGDDYGLVTFDPDKSGKTANIASYGLLQFKKPTVIQYVKQLRGKDISGKEAILLALNEKEATQLAYEIIFQVKGGVENWYTCAKKTNAHANIEIIRKLEE